MNREKFWNSVETANKQVNAQYAREIIVALPIDLTDEQNIALARDYIQKNFVDRGIAVDWAFHKKPGNPHIHIMMPMRGFTKDGKWAPMQKSAFKLDKDGNKIPVYEKDKNGNLLLDTNGQPIQKVRIRKGKGTEKVWERTSVAYNDWNTRSRMYEWRKEWIHSVNHHLEINGHEQRLAEYVEPSKKNRDPDIMIMKHEGYAARKMEKNGIISDVCEYNRQAKKHNEQVIQQSQDIELTLLLLIQFILNILTLGQIQIIPDFMLKPSYLNTARKNAEIERSNYGESNISRTTNTLRNYATKPASNHRREYLAQSTIEADNRRLQLTADGLRVPERTEQIINQLLEYFKQRGVNVPELTVTTGYDYSGPSAENPILSKRELATQAVTVLNGLKENRKNHQALIADVNTTLDKADKELSLPLSTPAWKPNTSDQKVWKPKTVPTFESKVIKSWEPSDR